MDAVNDEQLAICKQRGHKTHFGDGWSQCEWCGIWLRQIRTIEERRDTPPLEEQTSGNRTDDAIARLNKNIEKLGPAREEKP